jgi:hypothetical protein
MKPIGIIECCIRLRDAIPELTIQQLLEMPRHELDALADRTRRLADPEPAETESISSLPIITTVIGVDGRSHYRDERHGFTLCARKVARRADSLDAEREGCMECLGAWCAILEKHLGGASSSG